MKIQNFIKICGLLTLAVFMAACPSSFSPPKAGGTSIPVGKGVVNLSLAGYDARTIFPDDLDNFAYSVTFSADEKNTTEEIVNGAGSFTLDAPFTWTGIVEAKFDDVVVGIAELGEFTLLEGGTKEFKNVFIQPAPGDDGTLSWAVEFPEDLTSAKLFYRAGETGTETEIDLLAASRVDLVSSGSINLEPGDYLFRAVLVFTANNLTAGKVEAVHIYPELNSTLEWSFPMEAFFEVEDVTVTVPINASAGITITEIVLSADDIAPINEYTKEGADYAFVIPKMRTDLNAINNLALVITTVNSVVNVPATNYVKADGALDMDAVDIFKLVGSVGANGVINVTIGAAAPVTYTENFQLDLIKNTAGTVAVEADDLYKVDTSSGIGPFTMTADINASVTFVREYYKITVPTPSNGTVAISGHVTTPSFRALPGTTITVTLAVDSSDYLMPDGPEVKYEGGTVPLSGTSPTWTFTMPSEDVTVTAQFLGRGRIILYSGGPKYALVGSEMNGGTGGGTNGTYAYANSMDGFVLEAPGEGRNGGSAITYNAGGEHPGESSFALSCVTAFDTTYSGALSFWMKASANHNTAFFGTGNNPWGNVITYFGESHANNSIPVTTEWQRYIVPIPVPQTSINRVFFWKATPGTTVYYFDDLEFIPAADVQLTSITIPATAASEFPYPVPVNLDDLTDTPHVTDARPMKFTFTNDDVSATLVSPGAMGNLGMRWYTLVPPSNYTYSVTGDVTQAGKTITPNDRGIPFTASLIFRGTTSNPMTGNFSVGGEVVTVPTVANGTVTVTPLDVAQQAAVGETITITLNPATGYVYTPDSISVTYTGVGTVVPVNRVGETLVWTFTMPNAPVTVTAAFSLDQSTVYIETLDDVKGRAWGWFNDFANNTYGYWKVNGGNSAENAILAAGQGAFNAIAPSNTRVIAGRPTEDQVISAVGYALGRNLPAAVDISAMDTVRILFRVSNDNITFALVLYNGGTALSGYNNITGETANNGTGYEVSFATPTANTWAWVEMPVSSFTGLGLNPAGVTGWGIRVKTRTAEATENTDYYIDTIMAQQD